MSDRPSQYRIDMQLAIIAKLRELDTTGEHQTTCDRDELEWRRLAMDGYQPCAGGGIILPGMSQSMLELLRLDPEAYFETVSLRRQSGWVDLDRGARESFPMTLGEAIDVVREGRRRRFRDWLRRR
ncbi:hypothetical protein QNA24_30035 [Rhodococcus qingshengii]|uniref:hypothetical protein n=1 Tax=Rhodococcus TaxID=1827 RepID=UPI001E4625C8|nr:MULTISPECIES: hypothetical protein [Rhodococcus]MCD2099610.1 hypothetical protein [Rhodococcus rhodochrous]MCD2123978.1 hypothetical protein [Rhodococcus rhodochrous]MCQ4136590.1 hypothetical protein [Rhodococcus rhodochrous]MDJ0490624.1 hypothetical protein [Rhodococcus qingshengii]